MARKPPVEEAGGGDGGALEEGEAVAARQKEGTIDDGEKEGEKEREMGRARKEGGGRGQVACRRGAAATLLG